MDEAPSPLEIRALRGNRSRAEFASLVGVTPLTVYRWELPPDSPELRRPRGKVLARLREVMAAPVAPLTAEPLLVWDGDEQAALAPALNAIDGCRLEEAERVLVALLSSPSLRSVPGRASAAIALARVQLLARHDTVSAMATLLGVGPDVTRLPRVVQLDYHLAAAFLFAHPDGQLFDGGKVGHHVALAEALLDHGTPDHRFFLAYIRLNAAAALYESALIVRAMEGFASVRELAGTRLHRCLALEAMALAGLDLTNVADAAQRVEALHAAATASGLPMQQLRGLLWRAEIHVEQGGSPARILDLVQQAERIQQRHRIADGVHAMLLHRNKGDALKRLGRVQEAEEALLEAVRIARVLAYTPVRIATSLARLQAYAGRGQDSRALADACLHSEDTQRELTRVFGGVLRLITDVQLGQARGDWAEALIQELAAFRRQGAWAIAYRYIVQHALTVAAMHGDLQQAERLLPVAERALEWSPSPTASALYRRNRGILLLRRGNLLEARQSVEAAGGTFEASGDVPEAALVRRILANLDALEGHAEADARLQASAAELIQLGIPVPPLLSVETRGKAEVDRRPDVDVDRIGVERLVVPFQRLSTRGVGAALLQRELLEVAAGLVPRRRLHLEEVDSTGGTMELGAREGSVSGAPEWFEFRDGIGRRLRLGVAGPLDPSERAALQVLLMGAALAFEVAGLRGFTAGSTRAAPLPSAEPELPHFVAASASMRKLKMELGRLSGSRATIIVHGESGTGKEVVARAIHELSRRSRGPYVTFNSAAVPRELFEGQLFGYRRGAFTGALTDHPGVIRSAEGGTLFLDEIGELPLDVQPKLLRFLESGEVLPLGERRPVQVDVRIIVATHRDLRQLVREGKFREDLYYRLQVIPVQIPPLRERREDVVALTRYFIRKLTPEGVEPPLLTPDGEATLTAHSWPGNVRELRNVIERSLAFEPLPPLLGAEQLRL